MLDFRKGFHFKDLLSFQERLYKKYLTSTNGIEHKRAVEKPEARGHQSQTHWQICFVKN